MKLKIYENEHLIGYIEFSQIYTIELPNQYYWFQAFLESLLNKPIYYNGNVLNPYSDKHLLACVEQFEIIKGSNLNWDIFIEVVGGDIRNYKILP